MFAVRSNTSWTGGDFYRSIRRLHLGTIGLVVFTLAPRRRRRGRALRAGGLLREPGHDRHLGRLLGRARDRDRARRQRVGLRQPALGGRPRARARAAFRGAALCATRSGSASGPRPRSSSSGAGWSSSGTPPRSRSRSPSSSSPTSPSSWWRWPRSGRRSGSRAGSSSPSSPGRSRASPRSSSTCGAPRASAGPIAASRRSASTARPCWLDADPADRAMRVRTYGSGVRREPRLGTGGGTFVLALLATVVYDGFSQTQKYVDLESWFLDRSTWLAVHETLLDSLIMVAGSSAPSRSPSSSSSPQSRGSRRPRSPTRHAGTRPR